MTDAVISVQGLRKAYNGNDAVRGIDLEVRAGEIFASLGPNGAGKTTTVEILEGYRQRSAGDVRVLGVDPERATRDWRARIGVVLQTVEQDELLTVRETLEEYAGYYPAPREVDRTLDDIGLSDQRDQRVGSLSGGQQRRLDVGLALIGDPEPRIRSPWSPLTPAPSPGTSAGSRPVSSRIGARARCSRSPT